MFTVLLLQEINLYVHHNITSLFIFWDCTVPWAEQSCIHVADKISTAWPAIDLTELTSFSLTPVPHTLGTANGFFNKTNEATMLHCLLEDDVDQVTYPKDTLYIQDFRGLEDALQFIIGGFHWTIVDIVRFVTETLLVIRVAHVYHCSDLNPRKMFNAGFCSDFH